MTTKLPDNPKKILIAGDTHANLQHCQGLIRVAKKNDCELILQLGDFGYFPATKWGVAFLKGLQTSLLQANLPLAFIDGNHDGHVPLRELYGADKPGFYTVRNGIAYIARGTRWEWSGVKFLGLGGAFSIDRAHRQLEVTWWREELITYGEARTATEGGTVDVAVFHDAPHNVDLTRYVDNYYPLPETDANRLLLQGVCELVQPKYVFHGHYHQRYSEEVSYSGQKCYVEGLASDVNPFDDSWVILDLERMERRNENE